LAAGKQSRSHPSVYSKLVHSAAPKLSDVPHSHRRSQVPGPTSRSHFPDLEHRLAPDPKIYPRPTDSHPEACPRSMNTPRSTSCRKMPMSKKMVSHFLRDQSRLYVSCSFVSHTKLKKDRILVTRGRPLLGMQKHLLLTKALLLKFTLSSRSLPSSMTHRLLEFVSSARVRVLLRVGSWGCDLRVSCEQLATPRLVLALLPKHLPLHYNQIPKT
jgi:hypothetical protein